MGKTQWSKHIVAAFAALLAMVFIAWQMGYMTGLKSPASTGTRSAGSEAPKETKAILAKVTGIAGTTLSVIPLSLGSSAPPTLTVLTDEATVFERSIPKDRKSYLDEMAVSIAKMKQNVASSTPLEPPPIPFVLKSISLADVRIGDTIFVTAAEDILKARQVTATKVLVQSAPPYAPPPVSSPN